MKKIKLTSALMACMFSVICYSQKETGKTMDEKAINYSKETEKTVISEAKTIKNSSYSDVYLNKMLDNNYDNSAIIDYVKSLSMLQQEIIQQETEKQIEAYYSSLPGAESNADNDGDGHRSIRAGGDDCNDNDPFVYPGNPEICGGIFVSSLGGKRLVEHSALSDEDCDPSTVSQTSSSYGVFDGDKDQDGIISCNCANFWKNDASFNGPIASITDETVKKWHSIAVIRSYNSQSLERSIKISGVDCDDTNPAIGKNSQVCMGETQVGTCVGGVWQVLNCRKCQTQPNGTGIVIEW